MSRLDDVKKLLDNHARRLQALQERKALYGLDAPIAIQTEIEDTEAEIENLQTELSVLKVADKLSRQRAPDLTPAVETSKSEPKSSTGLPTTTADEPHPNQPGNGRFRVLIGLAAVILMGLGLGAYFFLARSGSTTTSAGMVKIPAGTYSLGRDSGGRDYQPAQTIDMAEFFIDKFEVTNFLYAKYVESYSYPPDQAEYPVRGVTWEEAKTYCKLVGKRLPTEAEWEAAARSDKGWRYPWGNDLSVVGPLPGDGIYPVGTFLPDHSYLGAFDMGHNVHEWVDRPYADVSNNVKVLRGGSRVLPVDLVTRIIGDPNSSTMIAMAGFRCAADINRVTEVLPSDRLLRDEFDDTASGWEVGSGENPGYHLPAWYHLEATEPNPVALIGAEGNNTRSDISMAAEIFVSDHETINDGDFRYGLVVRQTSDDEYLAFTISPNTRLWYALKQSPEGLVVLGQGAAESLAELAGGDVLRVDASGTTFAFSINGRLVHHFTDSESPPAGDIGFYVETLGASKVHIHVEFVDVSLLPPNPIAAPTVVSVADPNR